MQQAAFIVGCWFSLSKLHHNRSGLRKGKSKQEALFESISWMIIDWIIHVAGTVRESEAC